MAPTPELLAERLVEAREGGRLDLGNCQLGTLPNDFVAAVREACPNAAELDLTANALAALPDDLHQLTHVCVLRASGNRLADFPAVCLRLARCETLELSRNALRVVPDGIAQLRCLRCLDVSCNALAALPASLGRLSALTQLAAADNALRHVPPELASCEALEVLQVQGNQLTALPTTLTACRLLRRLDASRNGLLAFQGRLYLWDKLRHLDLASNCLRTLPSALGWLCLESLDVASNRDLRVPRIVLEQPDAPVAALLTFLQIICEQHRLIERHMDKFACLPGRDLPADFLTADPARSFSARPHAEADLTRHNDAEIAAARCRGSSLVDLRCCGLAELAPELVGGGNGVRIKVLDVRYNQLASLPSPTWSLPSLVILNASHNRLTRMPDEIDLPKLAVLNASFNSLRRVPAALAAASRTQQLYLSANKLDALPDELSAIPLVDLFISENRFTVVPGCVPRMRCLLKLSMACNRLEELPPGLGDVASLQFLDVSFNLLTDLPPELAKLTALEAVNVAFNPLGAALDGRFPSALFELAALRELNCDYTGCHVVDAAFGRLQRLEALQLEGCELQAPWANLYAREPVLLARLHDMSLKSVDLSACGLAELPPGLTRLTALRELNLADNELVTLPPELAKLRSLETLHLVGNPLAPHLAAMLERGGSSSDDAPVSAILALLSPVVPALDLSNLSLANLPNEVLWHEGRLRQLKLSRNALRALPAALAVCSALEWLELDDNELEQVPEVVLRLGSLQVLQVAGNRLQALPMGLGAALPGLRMLSAARNALTSIAEASLEGLVHLQGLSLAGNRLTSLPDTLRCLSMLRVIDVSGNALHALPDAFRDLTRLRSLRAADNQLAALPPSVTHEALPALEDLRLTGNLLAAEVVGSSARTRDDVLALLAQLAEPQAPRVEPMRPSRSAVPVEPSESSAPGRLAGLEAKDAGLSLRGSEPEVSSELAAAATFQRDTSHDTDFGAEDAFPAASAALERAASRSNDDRHGAIQLGLATAPGLEQEMQATIQRLTQLSTAARVQPASEVEEKWRSAGAAANIMPIEVMAASDPASATMSAELFLASLRHMHPPPEPAAGSLQRPQHRARIKRVVDSQLATMALVMKELGGAPA